MMRWAWVTGLVLAIGSLGCDPAGGGSDDGGGGTGGVDGALDGAAGAGGDQPDGTPADATPADAGSPADAAVEADAGGCMSDDDCEGPRRCIEGACVACLADEDCIDGYLCEAGECAEGCREGAPCPAGSHCADGMCAAGCLDESHCVAPEGCIDGECVDCSEVDPCMPGGHPACYAGLPPCRCETDDDCEEGTYCDAESGECLAGCRDDDECGPGQICDARACRDGCRDDADCGGGLCEDPACIPLGVGCREDDDCGAGEECAERRCVPAVEMCPPDRLEPNDAVEAFTPLMFDQLYDRVSICPGDRDLYGSLVPAGHTIRARLQFDWEAPLAMRLLDEAGEVVAPSVPGDVAVFLEHTVEADGVYLLEVSGTTPETRNAYVLEVGLEAPILCVDTPIYPDGDGDGFGVDAGAEDRCLEPDEPTPGFARVSGDCSPVDPWAHPESTEICGDWVDDDCDGVDQACPATRPAVQVPDWNCGPGAPPANVYGWARFDDGGGYFVDGGCFVFFEGVAGEFYVRRALERANNDPSCERRNGCTCPSLGGWPSYDRRLYAFTLAGDDPDACDQIGIVDHAGEQQPVSNHCRKYLYQMHFYDIPYSLVAVGQAEFERRLALFPTVEVACAADLPHRNLPYQSLLTTAIERNPDWVPMAR